MTTEWILASLIGIGKLFLNPLFYLSFILCWIIGTQRVKQERRDFNVKIYDRLNELRMMLPQGLLWGMILSLLTLGVGIVIPFAAIIVIAAMTIILALTTKVRFLSPAYTISLSALTLFFLTKQSIQMPIFKEYFAQLDETMFPTLVILLGLLLIAEGYIILSNGVKDLSPQVILSKRGQPIGRYAARRLWLLPMFVLIPQGDLSTPFSWYPILSIGQAHIAPIVVPFIIGFAQQVQGIIPEKAIKAHGKQVVYFGFFMTTLGVISVWYPFLLIASVMIAIVGREWIYFIQKSADHKRAFYFSESKRGLKILGVIPQSPAEKMGLEKGEVISKINGVAIYKEVQFYEVLQKNRAQCRLEIVGLNGELRFIQRALFEGEHYELGLLFIEDQLKESQAIL